MLLDGSQRILSDPVSPLQEKMKGIAAYVNRTVDAYAGPGKKYGKENLYKVDASTVLKICAQEGEFYLAAIGARGKEYVCGSRETVCFRMICRHFQC